MQTNNIKKVAPKARIAFMEAVSNRLNDLGLYADKEPAEIIQSGNVFQVNGRSFPLSSSATILASRNRLKEKVQQKGFLAVTEEVAYTWFNRFCAIRYMELHDDFFEHGIRILSHPNQPHGFEAIDKAVDLAKELEVSASELDQISDMKMAGNQDEAIFRQLLLAQCHYLHKAMPFMFEAINDESELLLPENLTRTDSIIRPLIDDIPEEDWQEIEVIGWLYQFYISEKKDEVIGKVVKSEDIPAATQLFTPNWIVKYLVQNSLGAKWLASYPDSEIKSEMEYYIEPAEQTEEVKQQLASITPDTLNIEEITLIDPACGSGHILVEAYELFKAIYQTQGYRARDIPQLILEKNLFGLDIDDRAAQLSSFALMMKAREDDRRIFWRGVELNVLSIQESSHLNLDSLWQGLNLNGEWKKGTSQGLFDEQQIEVGSDETDNQYQLLKRILERFVQAKTFGSLIEIPADELTEINKLLVELEQLAKTGDTMQIPASIQLISFVKQAQILAHKYDAVVANPPYMTSKYHTLDFKKFMKSNFEGNEKDLFSAFISRSLQLTKKHGLLGFMTPFVWMFISSHEKLRNKLINDEIITSLIQLEYSGFDGATVPICTFTLKRGNIKNYTGCFIRLSNFKGSINQAPKTLEAINNRECNWFYERKSDDFNKIPGKLIAYWIGSALIESFTASNHLGGISKALVGLQTSDNDRFLRYWFEVALNNISLYSKDKFEATKSGCKWFPHIKGGGFRRWYGFKEYVINWGNDGEELKESIRKRLKSKSYTKEIRNEQFYFKPSISWGSITSKKQSFRFSDYGTIFNIAGPSIFSNENNFLICQFLNSKVSTALLEIMCPTINFTPGDVSKLPIIDTLLEQIDQSYIGEQCISISKSDWDMYETSWDFSKNPLITGDKILKDSFNKLLHTNEIAVQKMIELEHKNNELFIQLYKLNKEITPDVQLSEISLFGNMYYRYGDNSTDNNLLLRFQSDTLSELISYSIACMMGRYSLDREGYVYANSSNEGFSELELKGAYKTFPADDDGIIPLTDETWFDDDATNRFKEFINTVFRDQGLGISESESQKQDQDLSSSTNPYSLTPNPYLEENLQFVADSLCLYALKPKKTESPLDTIRRYLTTVFYKQHLKTYKKRPIYWLFSSGKQKAFECLVYLHRYNEATLSRMRTEYVTPLLGKFDAQQRHMNDQINNASSTAEVNKYKKALTTLEKKQSELREFDDRLKHYADMQIKLDLDDGVKVNYGKFGDLLANVKEVTGKKPVVSK